MCDSFQWLTVGRWFPAYTPFSSTTDRPDMILIVKRTLKQLSIDLYGMDTSKHDLA